MQPVVDYSRGSCVYDCNQCSNVCPPNALLPLSLAEKQRTRIGMAIVGGSCVGCGICASNCPANAIWIESRILMPLPPDAPQPSARPPRREAETQRKAKVILDYCIGCGVCQNVCPLPSPAIAVSGVSEQILVKKAEPRNETENAEKPAENEKADEGEKPADNEQSSAASSKPVAAPIPELCVGCGLCSEECPVSAIAMVDGLPSVNADACVGCGLCSEACPAPDGPAIVVQG